ncbi:MAG TPA: hypothetical protein VFT43_03105 [Candidatus Polarisedimenticolia bacterium]|nr:hypothetical protein [Candidatus Polarisedimenticolia bacterium]
MSDNLRGATEATSGRPSLWLQVTAMFLTALLPVAWLVGRRTAPAARALPSLVSAADQPIPLLQSARALAAKAGPLALPVLPDPGGAYRLSFLPVDPSEPARPPYRLRLEAPGGDDIWQGSWERPGGERARLELLLPGAGLRPGRYALRLEDAAGTVQSFPFVVPERSHP